MPFGPARAGERGKAVLGYLHPETRLAFFVEAGEVCFLERVQHPKTWSQFVERQTRRKLAAR